MDKREKLIEAAKNAIIDYIRADKRNRNTYVDSYVDSESGKFFFELPANDLTDTLTEQNELSESLQIAFNSLKPKQLKIASMFFVDQFKFTEIAEICDIPLNTVKVTILRCREKLQSKLQRAKKEYAIA